MTTATKLIAALLIAPPALAGVFVACAGTREPEVVYARPIYHPACTQDVRPVRYALDDERAPLAVAMGVAWLRVHPECTEGMTLQFANRNIQLTR